ncbi:MAG: hypothetical protein Q8R70_11380, partial [Methanoregula sp.]|nr:hypothetical protein [Methanoregula sp.]
MKKPIHFLVSAFVILLVFASGCTSDILIKASTGNFGEPSDPALARPATPVITGTPFPATTPTFSSVSAFTCDYDENLIKTSPEFSVWFNTSCYYNNHCGWW